MFAELKSLSDEEGKIKIEAVEMTGYGCHGKSGAYHGFNRFREGYAL